MESGISTRVLAGANVQHDPNGHTTAEESDELVMASDGCSETAVSFTRSNGCAVAAKRGLPRSLRTNPLK